MNRWILSGQKSRSSKCVKLLPKCVKFKKVKYPHYSWSLCCCRHWRRRGCWHHRVVPGRTRTPGNHRFRHCQIFVALRLRYHWIAPPHFSKLLCWFHSTSQIHPRQTEKTTNNTNYYISLFSFSPRVRSLFFSNYDQTSFTTDTFTFNEEKFHLIVGREIGTEVPSCLVQVNRIRRRYVDSTQTLTSSSWSSSGLASRICCSSTKVCRGLASFDGWGLTPDFGEAEIKNGTINSPVKSVMDNWVLNSGFKT